MANDVIGVLQDVVKTQTGGGGKNSCVNITLCDIDGNVIKVALWEDYDKQLMNYQNTDKVVAPNIIILTHSWCKQNTGLENLNLLVILGDIYIIHLLDLPLLSQ
ncbi:hypothetical protein RYX36_011351 [Vicia faba]